MRHRSARLVKNSKLRPLTKCLCNVTHGCPVNQQDKKCQIKEQRETVLKVSIHCYYNTPVSPSLGFRNGIVDPLPITWDEFRDTACRSTRMEDEYEIGRGVVGPQRR